MENTIHIAIATNDSYPHLIAGELLLPIAFQAVGITARPVVWNDPAIDWSQYDAVILRSCWGYHEHIPQFFTWLQTLEDLQLRIENSPSTIRWNAHKKYLLDLAERGVVIPPTTLIAQGDSAPLESILSNLSGNDYIIKPCYGAGASGILRTPKNPTSKTKNSYAALLQRSDVLIQSYIPEIAQGELSAIFIGGTFSHAVLKIPKTGDFRSNSELGGSEQGITLDTETIAKLTEVYKKCAVKTLYARLDVVVNKDIMIVMELELIEPYLYFEHGEGAASRLVQAFTPH
jgi:glutathione synthase/RimK-type ligase-like ATP-grasp enzyme